MNVYITNFNASRIIASLNHQLWFGTDTIFHKQFKWLNIREVSELHAYYFLYVNPSKITSIYKRINPKRNDFVFESSPAYHTYQDCTLMKSPFENFKIPDSIKKQGNDKINEYRKYFSTNKELIENEFDFFKDRVRWKFGVDCVPEKINRDNSGITETDNYSLEEIREKVRYVISETKKFTQKSNKNKVIVDKFGEKAFLAEKKIAPKYNYTDYSNEEIWEVLNEFNEHFKKPYKKYIVEFFRISKNPDLAFENNLLNQLGFVECKKCQERNVIENIMKIDSE